MDITGSFCRGKENRCKINHSPPSGTEVMDVWTCNFTLKYSSMILCSFRHRDSFAQQGSLHTIQVLITMKYGMQPTAFLLLCRWREKVTHPSRHSVLYQMTNSTWPCQHCLFTMTEICLPCRQIDVIHSLIQSVPGGMCNTSGECSLC